MRKTQRRSDLEFFEPVRGLAEKQVRWQQVLLQPVVGNINSGVFE